MLNVKFAKTLLWSLGVIKDLKNSSSDKVTYARCYDQNKYWGSTKAKNYNRLNATNDKQLY